MSDKKQEPIVIQAWKALASDKKAGNTKTPAKKQRPEPIVIQAWRSLSPD